MTIVLSVAAVSVVVAAWTPLRRRPVLLAGSATAVAVGWLALAVSGPRWMIVPLGLAVAGTAATVLLRLRSASRGTRTRPEARWSTGLTSLATVVSAVVAGGAAWALPTLELPPPSGPFGVGTSTLQWDTGRPELLTADPGDTRVLVAQLWYPTEAEGVGRPYLESPAVADAVAARVGLPGFLLDGVHRGTTNAVADAPRATGAFPLVLFSPGLGGVRTQNSAWAEDLASHGYVVAAIDHPHDSAAVVLEDGTLVTSTLRATGDDEADQRAADDLASMRADDLVATLDRLEEDGVDVGRVATAGHSLGGAAALLAASRDRRVDAVVNLDGLPRGGRPTVPVLAVVAGEGTGSAASDERYDEALSEVLGACGTRVVVEGAQHLSFTDAALFLPPLPSLIGSGGRTAGIDAAARATRLFLESALGDGAVRGTVAPGQPASPACRAR